MKHIKLFSLLFAILLTGCATSAPSNDSVTDSTASNTTVTDIMEQSAQVETSATPVLPTPTPSTTAETVIPAGFGSYNSADIDLTTMSSTMVYTQVYDMISNPERYYGQTVKLHGEFGYYLESTTQTYYFGIIVQDATACCAQGVEFVLADAAERSFPDDYPSLGESATVVGIFNGYFPPEDPDVEYYHLTEAEFITE